MKLLKSTIFLWVVMLIFSHAAPTFAETPTKLLQSVELNSIIIPQWINTSDVVLDLYFENNKAECIGSIYGIAGTSKITATFKLERKVGAIWKAEKSWSTTSNGTSLSFYESDTVTKGYLYRLTVTAKVTRNGVTESLTTYVESMY